MQDRTELEQEYQRLARRADDRMRAIEANSHKPGFGAIKNYAYGTALEDIKRLGRPNSRRFGTGKGAIPKSTRKLQAKINAINKFLESPTSTMTGVRKMYVERAKNINDVYGTNFTWRTMANYFGTGLQERLEKEVGGSGFALDIVATVQSNKRTIRNALKKLDGQVENLDDEIVQDSINDLLSNEKGREILQALLG